MSVKNYVMKSGKYEGWKLDDIPLSYIAFVYEEWDVSEETREIFRKEIWRRTDTWELLVEVHGQLQEKEPLKENFPIVTECINKVGEKIYQQ